MSPRGQRRALLIGTSDYQDERLRYLRAPAGDVNALAAVLADPAIGAFDVSCAIDRDTQDTHETIEGFFTGGRPLDMLLLYISGHGIRSPDGRLHLATRTTNLAYLKATTVGDRFIVDSMRECRARTLVLILDCCHSGAFGDGYEPKGADADSIQPIFDTSKAKGRVVITASNHLGYAFEDTKDPGNGSVFTTHMVEGLRTGEADLGDDGEVSVDELYDYVYESMIAGDSHQVPGISIHAYGKIIIARNPRWRPPKNDGDDVDAPQLQRLHHNGRVRGVAFAAPTLLASASDDATARLWAVRSDPPEQWRCSHAHRGRPARGVLAVAASPVGGVIATAGRDGSARVWDLAGDERRRVTHRGLRTVALSRDGSRLATAGDDNRACIWNVSSGREERRIYDDAPLNGVSFSPDGTALARGGQDHLVRVWSITGESRVPLHEYAHDAPVWGVAFSPDGLSVASTSSDKSARVWELAGREHPPIAHGHAVFTVAFSPDGRRLATAGDDVAARVWNLADRSEVERFRHNATVWAVAFSPDGALLATGSSDGSIRVWPL